MAGLEIYSHKEEGFMPLVNYGNWRVAISNGPAAYKPKVISQLSRHCETDEVFVILKGSGELLVAGNGEIPGPVEKIWMEPGYLYNVTKGTWHSNILMPGASALVVENKDTSGENSQTYRLQTEITL
jgi:mannose-6-phosphate isomerase-like protein (cupin superfamily)